MTINIIVTESVLKHEHFQFYLNDSWVIKFYWYARFERATKRHKHVMVKMWDKLMPRESTISRAAIKLPLNIHNLIREQIENNIDLSKIYEQ